MHVPASVATACSMALRESPRSFASAECRSAAAVAHGRRAAVTSCRRRSTDSQSRATTTRDLQHQTSGAVSAVDRNSASTGQKGTRRGTAPASAAGNGMTDAIGVSRQAQEMVWTEDVATPSAAAARQRRSSPVATVGRRTATDLANHPPAPAGTDPTQGHEMSRSIAWASRSRGLDPNTPPPWLNGCYQPPP